MSYWQTGPPPNEELVEVENNGVIIKAMAFYGRDGWRPHWRGEDGTHWSVGAFRRWRRQQHEQADAGDREGGAS